MFVNIFNDLFGIKSFSLLLLIVAEGYDGCTPRVRHGVVEGYGFV